MSNDSSRRNLIKAITFSPIVGLAAKSLRFQDCITTTDIEGPFYIPNSPRSATLNPEGAMGTPLFITGSVFFRDCETPISQADLDIWAADDAGQYLDNEYRGIVSTDDSGGYAFHTILPGKYLNGARFRPRHLHVKVRFSDIELTTQIYFEGDTSIEMDPWAAKEEATERIIKLEEDNLGALHGVMNFILDLDGATTSNSNQYRIKSSSIQKVYNQSDGNLSVTFNLDKSAKTTLILYDISGRERTLYLRETPLSAGTHHFAFSAGSGTVGGYLPMGIYILSLRARGQILDTKRFYLRSI